MSWLGRIFHQGCERRTSVGGASFGPWPGGAALSSPPDELYHRVPILGLWTVGGAVVGWVVAKVAYAPAVRP